MTKDEQHKLFLFLGRLEGKVDTLLKTQGSSEKRMNWFEGRLNHVERSQAYWAGSAALAGGVLYFLIQMILAFFK